MGLRGRLKSLLACCSLAIAAPVLIGGTDLTSNMEVRALAAQNRERAVFGAPPLYWNTPLAESARVWADKLAASGKFEHAPEKLTNPEGENLWAGSKGYFAVEGMVGAWIREKRYFKPGKFPENSTTGRVEDIGHYTQLVWGRTRQVGCALAKGEHDDFFVCRYREAGNYIGETPL